MSVSSLNNSSKNKILLANPRGYCAGVRRALETLSLTLQRFGAPIYVLHEIVHNEFVVDNLRREGVVFIESLEQTDPNRPLLFSAHGVSKKIESQAREMGLQPIDATCPLVKKIHRQAERLENMGRKLVLIGNKSHPEVIGTLGQLRNPALTVANKDEVKTLKLSKDEKIAYVTQSTLAQDDISEIVTELSHYHPDLLGSDNVCYATENRQKAVRRLAKSCDMILVLGSPKSSNSKRLKEVAEKAGVPSFLIRNYRELNLKALPKHGVIGISSAASAPEILIEELCRELSSKGWDQIEEFPCEITENVTFALPEIP